MNKLKQGKREKKLQYRIWIITFNDKAAFPCQKSIGNLTL